MIVAAGRRPVWLLIPAASGHNAERTVWTLPPGSVWLQADRLVAGATGFTGLRIAGGELRIDRPASISARGITVPSNAGWTVALAGSARARLCGRLGCRRSIDHAADAHRGPTGPRQLDRRRRFTRRLWLDTLLHAARLGPADRSRARLLRARSRETSAGQLPAIDPAPFSSPVRVPSTGRCYALPLLNPLPDAPARRCTADW